MATYQVRFYDFNPGGAVPTGTGSTFTWNGPSTADGVATINDTESGIEGLTLDDDNNGRETATANVTLGGASSTGASVDAELVWTVRDTVTGDTFEIAQFEVESGGASGMYTLSEMPLVAGRSYEVVNYDSNPNVLAGDPVFSSTDYVAPGNVVSGTDGDDTIDASYSGDPEGDHVDSGLGTGPGGNGDVIEGLGGDDTIFAGAGDDTIYGGAGQDTIDGGAGNDTIYGDAPASASQNEHVDWSAQGGDGKSVAGGFTQSTGQIDVTVSFQSDGNNAPTYQIETSDPAYTESGEPFAANSNLYLYGAGDGATSTTTIDFSANDPGVESEVENIQFRINDIDAYARNHQDVITVNAYDADGNPVPVTITSDGNDTVSGNTITAAMTLDEADNALGSALVEIAGPVARVEITYSNAISPSGNYSGTHAIWVSDVYYDTVPVEGDADIIDGGSGDDVIDGGEGDDTLTGGTGADTLSGGTGGDTLHVAEGDTASGGAGDDTFLVSDLGEAGAATIDITGGEGDETLGDTLNFQGLIQASDITYTNTDDASGGLSGYATLSDGTVVNFSEIENVVICFAAGTFILTPHGERTVESLKPGDLVITADHGLQPIRWIGIRAVPATGPLAPVRIRRGTLGNTRDLRVSPQHRMLLGGYRAELLFGESEVLVPALHLVDDLAITREAGGTVTYVHLLFDRHEVIFAEGTPSESFHPGHVGLDAILAPAREELFRLFPDLRADITAYGPATRLSLKKHEAHALRMG
ncbi:Hint domain-containing protein [Actibacterium sp. D379-3]